jgi:hypothetical protein
MSLSEAIFIDTGVPSRRASWASATAGLLAALVASVLVSGVCAVVCHGEWPTPGSPIGLVLGTTGLVFMLGAQTLYTVRKRLPGFSRGRMSTWLQSHIFMGLFGAFLVAMHAGGRMQGVAGAAMVALAIVIASGLVGRYLYTAAPRTIDGIEIDSRELQARLATASRRIEALGAGLDAASLQTVSVSPMLPGSLMVFCRPLVSAWYTLRTVRIVGRIPGLSWADASELRQILADRRAIQFDILSVAAARRWLSWWHVFHVPASWVMFTLAFVHVVAAISYLVW